MPSATFVEIPSLSQPIAVANAINLNFARALYALDKCLFRDGTVPNQMEANINLNGFSLENAALGEDVTVVPADA